MFKAHIVVGEDTDVSAELAKIESLARKHDLDDIKIFAMVESIESILADLKQQDSETAAYGIKMAIRKTVATDDYQVTLELRPRKASHKNMGFLARLLHR